MKSPQYIEMQLHRILDHVDTKFARKRSEYRWNQYKSLLQRIQTLLKTYDPSFGTSLPWQDGRDTKFILLHKETLPFKR